MAAAAAAAMDDSKDESSIDAKSLSARLDTKTNERDLVRRDDWSIVLCDESVEKVVPDIRCPICYCIIVSPVQTPCGHVFCNKCAVRCATETKKCPKDRRPLNIKDVQPIPASLYRMVFANLQVKCPLYIDKGCRWSGDYGSMIVHLISSCEYHPIPCTFCERALVRRELKIHMESECLGRIVKCPGCKTCEMPFKELQRHISDVCVETPVSCVSCDTMVPRGKISTHRNECPRVVVSCPYLEQGCGFSSERSDMPKHETDAAAAHVRLMHLDLNRMKERLALVERKSTVSSALSTASVVGFPKPRLYAIQRASSDIYSLECTGEIRPTDLRWLKWITGSTITNRAHRLPGMCANVMDERIYILGRDGDNGITTVSLDTKICHTVDSKNYNVLLNDFSSAVVYKDRLYVTGGSRSSNQSTRCFSLRMDSDTPCIVHPSMIRARDCHASVVSGDSLYVLGGRSEEGTIIDHVERFHENVWQPCAPLPAKRESMAAITTPNGCIMVFGGVNEESKATDTVYVYDRNEWSTVSWRLPVPLWGHNVVYWLDRIWIIGGWNGIGWSTIVYVVNPATGDVQIGPSLPIDNWFTTVFG